MKYASMARRSYLTMPPLIPNGVLIRCRSFTDSRATPRSRFFYPMVSFTALYVLSIPRAGRSRRQRSSQHSATMPVAWRNLSAHNGGGRNAIERPLGVACCRVACPMGIEHVTRRSEEHTSELQSLMRISYAVFCLKKKTKNRYKHTK